MVVVMDYYIWQFMIFWGDGLLRFFAFIRINVLKIIYLLGPKWVEMLKLCIFIVV